MPRTTVDYNNLTGEAKEAAAMKDIRSYLGSRFKKIHNVLKAEANSLETLRMNCGMFLGIEGYPCEAWWNLIVKEREAKD